MSRPGASAAEWIGHVPATRLRLSVGVVSAVTIALELMLMRVLAIRFWHHFAALIIATALLGFGAGGTLLTLLRPWVLRRARGTLWALAVALAAAILLSLRAGQAVPLNVRFFAWDRGQIWNLLGVELIFLAPLLLCGTIVGTALMDAPERIGGHYAANLVGSGVGGALPALLLGPLTTEQVMGVLVWLAYLAALLLLPWRRRGWVLASAGAGLALVAMQCFWPWSPGMSQYKLLPQLRLRGDVETLHRSESLLGRVEVVAGPSIHYVPPGRSLNAPDPVPEAALILIDGDPAGPVYDVRSAEGFGFLDWTLSAVAYRLLERPRTLILGADGGRAVGLALFHGARRIVAVEPNRQIVSAMEGPLRRRGGWIWRQQAVEVHNVQARGYLAAARERFDLIHLPFLWVSAIGVDATRAEYLLTVEAFEKMLSRLGPGGVIVAACESRTPPRGGLRLLATLMCLAPLASASDKPIDRGTANAVRSLAFDLAEHPEAAAEDLYKFLHQAIYGPGHAIPDQDAAAKWLDSELEDLGPLRVGEPPCEVLGGSPILVRVNLRPFAAGGACQAAAPHLAQVARRQVAVVEVLALGVDEIAEGPLGGPAAAVHRLGTVTGGLAVHEVHARALDGLNQSIAPFEDLVAVGHADEGHRAVDVLAGLHRLDRLGGMQPMLSDDHHGLDVARQERLEGVVGVPGVELVLERLQFREALDALRHPVAQGDAVHQGVRLEERRERGTERPQPHQAYAYSHRIPPVQDHDRPPGRCARSGGGRPLIPHPRKFALRIPCHLVEERHEAAQVPEGGHRLHGVFQVGEVAPLLQERRHLGGEFRLDEALVPLVDHLLLQPAEEDELRVTFPEEEQVVPRLRLEGIEGIDSAGLQQSHQFHHVAVAVDHHHIHPAGAGQFTHLPVVRCAELLEVGRAYHYPVIVAAVLPCLERLGFEPFHQGEDVLLDESAEEIDYLVPIGWVFIAAQVRLYATGQDAEGSGLPRSVLA